MSKLNEKYTDVMNDVIAALLPMITEITSAGLDDPNMKAMTDITLKSVGLGGDMMQAIDDLQANQNLLLQRLNELEFMAREIKQENSTLAGLIAAKYNDIDTRIDGLEALITKPDKKKEKIE